MANSSEDMFVPVTVSDCHPPSWVKDRVKAHDNGGQCVAFSPQGTKIATAGNDGYVKLWSTNL